MNKLIAYHSTDFFIDEDDGGFNLNFLDGGEHQHGIGIYFAKEAKHTNYYKSENGNTYEVHLDTSNIKDISDEIELSHIISIMSKAPNLETTLQNFEDLSEHGMSMSKAIKSAAKSYENMSINRFLNTFSGDFFYNDYKTFLELFYQITKIDGAKIIDNNREMFVMFNPNVIKIQQNLNTVAEEEYQNKKQIEKNKQDKVKSFISKYNTREEMMEDIAFHGTGVNIEGDLRVGGDRLLWTADNPQISQSYISDFSYSYYSEPLFHEHENKIYPSVGYEISKLELMGYTIDGIKNNIGGYRQYKLFKDGQAVDLPTQKDFIRFCANYGYFSTDRQYKIKKYLDENGKIKIIHANEKAKGELFIFSGISKLKILDVSLDEGDLTEKQYLDYELFERAEADGYDGVKINDFVSSEYYGHYGHLSIGLTESGLKKVDTIRIDVSKFDWEDKEYLNEFITDDLDILGLHAEVIKEKNTKKKKKKNMNLL